MKVSNDLQTRCVDDVLIAVANGLKGRTRNRRSHRTEMRFHPPKSAVCAATSPSLSSKARIAGDRPR